MKIREQKLSFRIHVNFKVRRKFAFIGEVNENNCIFIVTSAYVLFVSFKIKAKLIFIKKKLQGKKEY